MHDASCIFCRIIRREIPSTIVCETSELLAFFDVQPKAPTHLLIVPKIHLPSVNELKPEHEILVGRMVLLAQELAKQHGVSETGYRLMINTGEGVGQSVFHLHLHLLGGRHYD